jgi:hypothetical protein
MVTDRVKVMLKEYNIKFECDDFDDGVCNITFVHKKIIYLICVEDEETISYGPSDMEETSVPENYMLEKFTEIGDFDNLEEFIYEIKNSNPYDSLRKIFVKLDDIERYSQENGYDFDEIIYKKYIGQ